MFLLLRVLSSFIFFFKQKTAYEMRIIDWSSDVCSSDLLSLQGCFCPSSTRSTLGLSLLPGGQPMMMRSEERRVGKECVDLGGRRIIKKKNPIINTDCRQKKNKEHNSEIETTLNYTPRDKTKQAEVD